MPEQSNRQFPELPSLAVILLALGLILLIGFAGWWLLRAEKAVLFSNLDERAANQVITALQAGGIPYEFSETSDALLVPKEDLLAIRMDLAAQGIPDSGSVGFELFSDTDYGMTEFAQRVNFQRALQGELERTITALAAVRDARVHLTLPNESVFLRDSRQPKASVTVTAAQGQVLSGSQIRGIQHLISAAVERLDAESVVVLNHLGNALTGPQAAAPAAFAGQGAERVMEKELEERLDNMLRGILGDTRFTVSVDAQLDYSRVHRTSERIIPQGADGAGLVQRRRDTGQPGNGRNESNSTNSSDIEYVHGRSIEEVEMTPGRLKRLTIGISIANSLPVKTEDRLRDVVAAAAGIDTARGDSIVLSSFEAISTDDLANIDTGMIAEETVPVETSLPAATQTQLPGWLLQLFAQPAWLLWSGVAAFVALLALLMALAFRSGRPAKLNIAERKQTLQEIESWLNEDVEITGKAA